MLNRLDGIWDRLEVKLERALPVCFLIFLLLVPGYAAYIAVHELRERPPDCNRSGMRASLIASSVAGVLLLILIAVCLLRVRLTVRRSLALGLVGLLAIVATGYGWLALIVGCYQGH